MRFLTRLLARKNQVGLTSPTHKTPSTDNFPVSANAIGALLLTPDRDCAFGIFPSKVIHLSGHRASPLPCPRHLFKASRSFSFHVARALRRKVLSPILVSRWQKSSRVAELAGKTSYTHSEALWKRDEAKVPKLTYFSCLAKFRPLGHVNSQKYTRYFWCGICGGRCSRRKCKGEVSYQKENRDICQGFSANNLINKSCFYCLKCNILLIISYLNPTRIMLGDKNVLSSKGLLQDIQLIWTIDSK